MTNKQECAIKLAISTMDRHFDRHWNSAYTNLNTGVSVGYGEAINILSDMVMDNDSKQTNADRIRNMSDEELAEFLITFKNTFGEEYEGEVSCMDWLQSEAK